MGRFLMTKRGLKNVRSDEDCSQIPSSVNDAIKEEPKRRMADLKTKIFQSRIPTFSLEKTVNETRTAGDKIEISFLDGAPEEAAKVEMQQQKIAKTISIGKPRDDGTKESKANKSDDFVPKKNLQNQTSGSFIPRKSFGGKPEENKSHENQQNTCVRDNQENTNEILIPGKNLGEHKENRSKKNSFKENQKDKSGSKSFGENQNHTSRGNKCSGENKTNRSLIPKMDPNESKEKIEKSVKVKSEDRHESKIPKKNSKDNQSDPSTSLSSSKSNQDIETHVELDEKNKSDNKCRSLIPKKSQEEKQETKTNLVLEEAVDEKADESLIPRKSQAENQEKTGSSLILVKTMEEKQDKTKQESLIPRKTSRESQDQSSCIFCGEKIILSKRICAEDKSFHRACFRCNFCNNPLRYFGHQTKSFEYL